MARLGKETVTFSELDIIDRQSQGYRLTPLFGSKGEMKFSLGKRVFPGIQRLTHTRGLVFRDLSLQLFP